MYKRKSSKTNLENKRIIFIEIGFIVALCAVLVALEYKTYNSKEKQLAYFNNFKIEEDITPILIKEKEVPKKPIPKTVFNVVEDSHDDIEEIIVDIFDLPDEPAVDWEPYEEPDIVDDDIPRNLSDVSKQPQFPGGEVGMYRFLANNFVIPRIDRETGNQGKIYVEFTIDKEGFVKGAKILRSLSPTADAEALRVIESMPKWEPAQQGIRKVAVRYILPIHVKLM